MTKTALSALDLYFVDIIGQYRTKRQSGNHDKELAEQAKLEFIAAMDKTLLEIESGDITEVLSVGTFEIRYIRDLVADLQLWNAGDIRKVYNTFADIRGKPAYPDSFFERL